MIETEVFTSWVKSGRIGAIMIDDIPGYEDIAPNWFLYEGEIYNMNRTTPVKGSPSRSPKYPYRQVALKTKDGKRIHKRKCRIIASAFVDGRTAERNQVDHINGDHADDSVGNLRWVTRQENMDFKSLRKLREGKKK